MNAEFAKDATPYQLIVFDLDGTLIDSRRDLADSANDLLESCGAPPLPEERIGRMVGEGAAVLVARVFAAGGIASPPDALARFLAFYDDRLLKHTRPYGGIVPLLDHLQTHAQLALLTNKPLAATRRILAGLDLARYFPENAVVGGDGPFPRKPDPAGLRYLMARAAVSPEATLMVGDSLIDWRTARAAATPICLARYGFGFAGFPLDALEAQDRIIDVPEALLAS
jgi:phosphoglycolate phosphatase